LADDILSILSIVTSITLAIFSIALAIFAIWQSNESRRETQANSSRIGEVLKEVEANSDSIKENVSKSMNVMQSNINDTQKGFMDMQKNMNEVFTKRMIAEIPQNVPPQEQFTMNLISTLIQSNPEILTEIIKNSAQSQRVNNQNTSTKPEEKNSNE
jgi:hypothetical protein